MNYQSRYATVFGYLGLIGMTGFSVSAATSIHMPNRPAAQKSAFTLASAAPKTLAESALAAADGSATKGAISSDKKSITFTSHAVRLVMHTGPDSDMLSYRVAGLRNPAIIVPIGATLHVLFVNNDEDMLHNVRFGAWTTKFPVPADVVAKTSVGLAPLPHVTNKMMSGVEMVVKAPNRPGKYMYFCTVKGHAQGGMWGAFQTR